MNIAIIGRTEILYETAILLHDEGHRIKCVITAREAPEYSRKAGDFEALADKLGAEFFFARNLTGVDVSRACKGLDVGVSINWPYMINAETIGLFRLGILNGHLGDLPKYRGNAVVAWALLNGEKEIMATVHFMEGNDLDCGRVVARRGRQIQTDTTIGEILSWASDAFPGLFVEALGRLASDNGFFVKYAAVSSKESFRCFPRLPRDGFIDWNLPVANVHNLIRASGGPYAGAYTYHLDDQVFRKLFIKRSRIESASTLDLAVPGHVLANDANTGESLIRCGDGVISLLLCRYEDEPDPFEPGKRWRSIRMRLGIRAEDLIWMKNHD